jgi:hypothetical protein
MSKQFENMQKLAFGKILIKESMENTKMSKSKLKEYIREMILAEYDNGGEDALEKFDKHIYEELQDLLDSGEISPEEFSQANNWHEENQDNFYREFSDVGSSLAVDHIIDQIRGGVNEAKKKKDKPEDVAPQEDVDIDLNMGDEQLPAEPAGEEAPPIDTMAPEADTIGDIDPTVKSIQDSLQKAFAQAKTLGDEKLMNQIGNTITMLVRTQVLGQQNVNENEDFNPFMDWKDDQIYDSLINIDQEQLVSQMMNAVEENPSITLFEFCKKFED